MYGDSLQKHQQAGSLLVLIASMASIPLGIVVIAKSLKVFREC